MKLIEYPVRDGSKFKLEYENPQEEYKVKKIKRAVQRHILEWQENLSLDFKIPYSELVYELTRSIENKFNVEINYEYLPFHDGEKPKIQLKTTKQPNGEVEVVCFVTVEFKKYVSEQNVDATKKKLASNMVNAMGLICGEAQDAHGGLDV